MNIKEIKAALQNVGIKCYDIFSIGKIIENGFYLGNLDAFISFVKEQDVPFVLWYENYADIEDYFITNEIVEKSAYYFQAEITKTIKKWIESHNQKLRDLDFDSPRDIVLAFLYEGSYFYVSYELPLILDGEMVLPAKEMIEHIFNKHQEELKAFRKEHQQKREEQKKKLQKHILADEKFRYQTNKLLRKKYITDVFANELGEEFDLLKKDWYREDVDSVFQGAVDFVEILWREASGKQ